MDWGGVSRNMAGNRQRGRPGPSRRWRANSRERSRMHCLNATLDRIRTLIPVVPGLHQCNGAHQKLSKIETLKLAINYITTLQTTLAMEEALDLTTFGQLVTRGLSQQTAQLVWASLRLHSLDTGFKEMPAERLQHQSFSGVNDFL